MTKNLGATRQTHHINRRTAQSVFRAFDYAKEIGKPFNHFITLHLPESAQQGAATGFTKIRHKFRDWLNYQQLNPPIYVYAFETQKNGTPHVHWVAYIPPTLERLFKKKVEHWMKRVMGSVTEKAIDIRRIDQNHRNYKHLAKYMMKGVDPVFVDHFHLQKVHEPQGVFFGKRAGMSIAVGDAVRKAAKFKPRRNPVAQEQQFEKAA